MFTSPGGPLHGPGDHRRQVHRHGVGRRLVLGEHRELAHEVGEFLGLVDDAGPQVAQSLGRQGSADRVGPRQ